MGGLQMRYGNDALGPCHE